MYTLREITPHGTQRNINLGNVYYFSSQSTDPEEFDRINENVFHGEGQPPNHNIYAIVTAESGKGVYPLYLQFEYYIMCSDGKTFANLTKK